MEGGKNYMSGREHSELLYEVYRNGRLFRSFPTKGAALHFLAAARELISSDSWALVFSLVSRPVGKER